MVVTCSEDGCVNTWLIRHGEVDVVSSKEVKDVLLTGIILLDKAAYVVGYDRDKLFKLSIFK